MMVSCCIMFSNKEVKLNQPQTVFCNILLGKGIVFICLFITFMNCLSPSQMDSGQCTINLENSEACRFFGAIFLDLNKDLIHLWILEVNFHLNFHRTVKGWMDSLYPQKYIRDHFQPNIHAVIVVWLELEGRVLRKPPH